MIPIYLLQEFSKSSHGCEHLFCILSGCKLHAYGKINIFLHSWNYPFCSFIPVVLMLADCTFESLVPAFQIPGSYNNSYNCCLYSWFILFETSGSLIWISNTCTWKYSELYIISWAREEIWAQTLKYRIRQFKVFSECFLTLTEGSFHKRISWYGLSQFFDLTTFVPPQYFALSPIRMLLFWLCQEIFNSYLSEFYKMRKKCIPSPDSLWFGRWALNQGKDGSDHISPAHIFLALLSKINVSSIRNFYSYRLKSCLT